MTSYLSYNGIPCECGACCAKVSDVHIHILWSNGYGASIRVFCYLCGAWTDWKYTIKNGLSFRFAREKQFNDVECFGMFYAIDTDLPWDEYDSLSEIWF